MTDVAAFARSPLFAGVAGTELELLARRARTRALAPGQALCRAGEPSPCCWLITAGLVDVYGASGSATEGEVLARHRKGAMIGELAVVLEEPYLETVVASIPTSALEISGSDLREMLPRCPQLLLNVLRSAHGRLARAHIRSVERQQGETVAVAVGASLRRTVAPLLAAARRASPRPVTSLDRQYSFAGAVTAADDLSLSHATVLLPIELDATTVSTLMRESDRVVALAGTAEEVQELSLVTSAPGSELRAEAILVGPDATRAGRGLPADAPVRVLRSCQPGPGLQLTGVEEAWLARHLTRTKIGLALGAGGAKGYAHVGVLEVLADAGYVVDYVSGSSIGAIVGACLAVGQSPAEIDETLRKAFTPEAVAEIFKISLSGRSSGADTMTRLLQEIAGSRTFADTVIPLTVMTVDLTARAPAPIRDGLLWEVLLAATSLAGVFPPYESGGHRLVDGLALVPVPTGAVIEDGADITVAVNLISADTLPRWPGGPPPEPPPERRRRVLDDLLEVMDLSQLSDSERHAELADVPITPRFGPGEWRDFHLADQFLQAGRSAAQQAIGALESLALPQRDNHQSNEQGGEIDRANPIRL